MLFRSLEVAQALDYLHAQGIVHRDLKSSNVMVLRDGRVKVLDFGAALFRESATDPITRHGEFVGTFAYASPEQIRGETVDARADLYSLGVLLYRLITGRRPFEADTPEGLARLHLEEAPRHPIELVPGLPDDLCRLILEMLAKTPGARPVSAAAVAARLAPHAGGERGPRGRPAPELVGRTAARTALAPCTADPHGGRLALIHGPRGAGAGHLMRLQCRELAARGWSAHHHEHVPAVALGAVGGLVRALARSAESADRDAAAPLLPLLAQRAVALSDDQRERLLGGFVRLVRAHCAAGRPLALGLRDIEKLPPLGLAALARLLDEAAREGWPLVLLATTARPREARGLLSPLAPPLDVPLEPLDLPQTSALIADVLGHRVPPASLCARVHAATGGRPGFVLELVHNLLQEGLLEANSGPEGRMSWTDLSAGQTPVPRRIVHLVRQLVGACSRFEQRILDALALAGMPLHDDELAVVLEADPPQVEAAVDRLVDETGLLERQADGRADFAVGLFAVRVRGQVRTLRRKVLTERLAAAVTTGPPSPARSRLLLQAGKPVEAARCAVAWAPARPAARTGATTNHSALLGRLFSAVRTTPDSALVISLGLAYLRASLDRDPGEPRIDRTLQALAQRLERLPPADQPPLAARLDHLRGCIAHARGGGTRAMVPLRRALVRARAIEDQPLALEVLVELAQACELAGDREQAATLWDEAGASPALDEAGALAQQEVATGRARLALERGDLPAAAAVLAGAPEGRHLEVLQAQLLHLEGRFTAALSTLEAALAHGGADREGRVAARLLSRTAEVCIDLHWLGDAREALGRLESIETARSQPELRVRIAWIRAQLLLQSGVPALAREVLEDALAEATTCGWPMVAARTHGWLATVAVARRDWQRAETHRRAAEETLSGRPPSLSAYLLQLQLAELWAPRAAPDPVALQRWVDGSNAPALQLRLALARLSHALHSDQRSGAQLALAQAQHHMDELIQRNGPAHEAALRLHPWASAIASARKRLAG